MRLISTNGHPLNHPKIAMTSLWRPMNHYETIIFVGYMHWNPTFGSLNFWNHNVCVLTAIKPTVFLVVHPEIILKSNEISIFPWLIQFNPIKIPSNHHWNPMKLTSFVIGHSLQSGKIMENHGSPPQNSCHVFPPTPCVPWRCWTAVARRVSARRSRPSALTWSACAGRSSVRCGDGDAVGEL